MEFKYSLSAIYLRAIFLTNKSRYICTRPLFTTVHTQPSTESPQIVLRDYQQRCISECLHKLKEGERKQVVSLPVGSGKTVIMANLIPSIPNPTEKATKTLILAHRTELLEQAQKQIERYNPNLRVAIEQSRRKVDIENTDVIVASVQTLGRAGSSRINKLDPELFKAIIIDEAHHAAASSYTRILKYFDVDHPDSKLFIWGCSATVRRHDGLSLSNVFQSIAYHLDFLEMVERGWLCPLKITTVETKTNISNVGIQNQDFKLGELAEAVNTSERNDIIVRSWLKYTQTMDNHSNIEDTEDNNPIYKSEDNEEDGKEKDNSVINDQMNNIAVKQRNATLVFAVDIAHTIELCNHFRKYGYHAEYITSNTPNMTRYDVLQRFRNGEFPILVNCGILTEGTDIPIIDCVLMARPTRSSVLFQQMFGRGMRLSPGKNDCLMIDFVDNFKRSGLVTFPTLLGLDPSTIVQGQNALDLEKRAAEEEIMKIKAAKENIVVLDEQCPIEAQLKITEYDDIVEFMASYNGLNKNVNKISSNAWVAVGEDTYALAILGQGLLVIKRQSDNSWRATFQRRLQQQSSNKDDQPNSTTTYAKASTKNKSKAYYTRNTKLPIEADDIETAIRASDTWVRHSLLAQNNSVLALANRFAKFRLDPMTERQYDILKKYKVQVKSNINKGQAMDLITRLQLGQARLWKKQSGLKKKKAEANDSKKISPLKRNNKSVHVL
ncbi:P-loop containing nucleoside triphosphate hydrolase protein [Cunninghamella echinulata]|nr:P-loop containing nucleoside triphosphate hydrolase protein [Cunninghamella echinulata]